VRPDKFPRFAGAGLTPLRTNFTARRFRLPIGMLIEPMPERLPALTSSSSHALRPANEPHWVQRQSITALYDDGQLTVMRTLKIVALAAGDGIAHEKAPAEAVG
jgi:hypothetical protein